MSAIPTDNDFDFLCLEELICSRLQEQVPALQTVRGESTLDGVKGSQLPTPSALVLWIGDTVVDDHLRESSLVEQTWTVVLIVKHAGDKTGSKTRNAAGPLLMQVVRALRGWQPNEFISPLRWTDSVEPEPVDGGFLYVPLVFKASFEC